MIFRRAVRPLRAGVAASEFAVCLPILVLIFMGMIEACTMIFLKQSLSVAAYEGMRTALEQNASLTDVEQTCQQILDERRVRGANISLSPTNFNALRPGEYFTLSVSAPCNDNSIIPASFFSGKTMTGAATMMKEF